MHDRYDFLADKCKGNRNPDIVSMITKHNMDYDMMIQLSYSIVATGTTEGQNFTQLAIAIGNRIRNFYHACLKNLSSFKTWCFCVKLLCFKLYG